MFAGFLTSVALNTLILITTRFSSLFFEQGSFADNLSLLPWITNGLFLLVFLLILPQFALAYLIALAIFFALPPVVRRLFAVMSLTHDFVT